MAESGWLTDPRYDAGLDELAALQAEQSRLHAAQARVLARLAARTSREGWQGEAPFDSPLLDVAGTLVLGQVAAGSRLLQAEQLVVRLPGALAALEAGLLAVHQAQVLLSETAACTPATCAEVERRLLEPGWGPDVDGLDRTRLLPPADLRRRVRRLVLELDADQAARREQAARRGMRVWVRPAEDGMSLLCALLPAEQAQAVWRQLSEDARRRRAGDAGGRTADQLRADLLVQHCTGSGDGGRALTRVVVHVPLATALGLDDAPADLEGHGPVSAAHARRLLQGAELLRAAVEPDSGRVRALDEDVVRAQEDARPALRLLLDRPPPVPLPEEPPHDPSARLARLVRLRDGTCDGVGCSVPASRCELDHHVPWPQGPTSDANLRCRSQRCHHAKHRGWTVEQADGLSTWTSPGGRRYLVPSRGAPPPVPP